MEYFVKKGIFLAPKSYYLLTTEDRRILKHKGLAKSLVSEEWFETQYAELHKTKQIPVVSNFQIDWESPQTHQLTNAISEQDFSQLFQ